MLTHITFEDAIQPLAVHIYVVTCLLHAQYAFQQHNYVTHAKTGQNQLKLAVWNKYQLFWHNIIIDWFARDVPLTNQRIRRILYEK